MIRAIIEKSLKILVAKKKATFSLGELGRVFIEDGEEGGEKKMPSPWCGARGRSGPSAKRSRLGKAGGQPLHHR